MPEHEARSLIEKARQEVYALAAGRRRWRMSIPAQADDSDFVICAGLDALEGLLTAGEDVALQGEPAHDLDVTWAAASRFIRKVIDALGHPQPPSEGVVDLESLALQVVGQIEELKAGEAFPSLGVCESECNPHEARCGAKFCTYEDMAAHEKTHSGEASPSRPMAPAADGRLRWLLTASIEDVGMAIVEDGSVVELWRAAIRDLQREAREHLALAIDERAAKEQAEQQIATLTAERDEARTDVTRMAQTRVGEKCRHHLDPLLTLEFLAQRECPICWMSAAQNSEALYRAEKTKAEAAEARVTALEAALKQIASLDNVHEPERGQDQRPPMIVALGRWNQCCQIAKRALLSPPPPSQETT